MKAYLFTILAVLMYSCNVQVQKTEIKLIDGYTNQPITNFKLDFINRDGLVVDTKVTDANGVVEYSINERVIVRENRRLQYFKTFPLEISSELSEETVVHYFYPTAEAEKRIMQWEKDHPGKRVPDFSLLDDVEIEVENKDSDYQDLESKDTEVDTTKMDESVKGISTNSDKEASYPGGVDKMKAYLSENIAYPEIAMEMGDQGKVFAEFVVEKNGLITQVNVLRGVSEAINAETIRVLRAMPKWTPAVSENEIVWARCRIPINFILQ